MWWAVEFFNDGIDVHQYSQCSEEAQGLYKEKVLMGAFSFFVASPDSYLAEYLLYNDVNIGEL